MKCYIQSWLSGVFSGSLPLMNKVHLYIFGVHLALFLLKKISLGMAAIYLHSNNTAVEEKKAQITRFLNSTLNNRRHA